MFIDLNEWKHETKLQGAGFHWRVVSQINENQKYLLQSSQNLINEETLKPTEVFQKLGSASVEKDEIEEERGKLVMYNQLYSSNF